MNNNNTHTNPTITQMKYFFHGLVKSLTAKERIDELEDRSKETTQSESRREKNKILPQPPPRRKNPRAVEQYHTVLHLHDRNLRRGGTAWDRINI